MTVLGLIVALCVVCIMVYVASRLPIPWSYVLYIFILLACIVILCRVTGILGGGAVLNQRV